MSETERQKIESQISKLDSDIDTIARKDKALVDEHNNLPSPDISYYDDIATRIRKNQNYLNKKDRLKAEVKRVQERYKELTEERDVLQKKLDNLRTQPKVVNQPVKQPAPVPTLKQAIASSISSLQNKPIATNKATDIQTKPLVANKSTAIQNESIDVELFVENSANKRQRYEKNIELLKANVNSKKSELETQISNLEKYKSDYKRYIGSVHTTFANLVKRAIEKIVTDYKIVYDELEWNHKEALHEYDEAKNVKVEPATFSWSKSLWNAITDEKETQQGNAEFINTLIVIDIIAAVVLLVWWCVNRHAINTQTVVLFFVINIAIVALRVSQRKKNIKNYNEHCVEKNTQKIESLKKTKDDCLQKFDKWKQDNPEWIDSLGNFRCKENILLNDKELNDIMQKAEYQVRSPLNWHIYANTYKFEYSVETQNAQDNSAQFLAGIDGKIADLKREKNALDSMAEQQIAEDIRKISELEREIVQRYEQFMQNLDIVDNLRKISSDSNAVADKILEQAQQRVTCDHLLVGQRALTNLQNKPIPVFIPWQNAKENTPGHILITCNNLYKKDAVELARNLIVRMLSAFHPGLVRLSFLDPQKSNEAAIFRDKMKNVTDDKTVDTSELYYKEVMSNDKKITEHIELLNAKIDEIQKILPAGCHSLAEYNSNLEQKAKPYSAKPYEVVVIFDFQSIATNNNRLVPLINSGAKHGVYLVVVSTEMPNNNHRYEQINMQKFIHIEISDKYEDYGVSYFDSKKQVTENDTFFPIDEKLQPLAINGQLSPALDRYFAKMLAALKIWKEKNKVDTGLGKIRKQPFALINNDFSVPVGVSENKPFNFELDQEGNTHTFILGMTGSGKSVLLHDILAAAVLKYNPEELNLYLMDFKKGGVEFNAYAPEHKDGTEDAVVIPHIKAALLDDCDRQVVVEILRRLNDEMVERGKLFRDANKKNLSEYNATAKKRLPSIILAVDECHLLFGTRLDDNQKKINQIVENIASQGRSQGIHLIFATQTLADSAIPDKIMKNISNRFVLRAADSDAHKLGIENPDVELKKLDKPGAAIYKTRNRQQIVYPDFLDEKHLPELMKNVCVKAKEQKVFSQDEQFIFRGTWEPTVAETSFKENPMSIGLSFSLNKEPLVVPILKKDGGNNLLIIGNREEQDGDAARSALRIVSVSLFSLTEYYRQNNKPCRILIINPSDTDIKIKSPYIQFLDGRNEVEKTFVELLQRIDGEDTAQPDTFLYILGAQSFRDLKNDRTFKLSDETQNIENFTSGWGAGSAKKSSEITYSKCLEKILDHGAHCGIHAVLQIDKASNLFVDAYNINNLFSYMVLLGMPESDARKLTKTDLPTEVLPTEEERLKAIFFNDATSKSTTFVPFALPEKEQKISE